jgi:hypothetical protein
VVNATFASLVINVEVLKIVVKVDTTRTEVAAQKCRMCGENCGDIDVTLPAQGYGYASLPFVKMSYNGFVELSGDVLHMVIN